MTDIDESGFIRRADETLGRLFERLEDALGDRVDVELQEGILTIDFDDGSRFVVNKHLPNRQIWLSSPLSGAAHFAWDGTRWAATRDGAPLLAVLEDDLSKLAGEPVAL